jgi:ABC-type glycerol-3-phosphate transport system substrate-binding protein
MQWMVDRVTQEKLLNAGGGGVPVRNSSWDLPVMNKPGLASLAAAMRESMKGSYGKPKMPNFFEIYDEMASIIQQIGLGQLTPEEGVKIGQEKLLKICKKCLL